MRTLRSLSALTTVALLLGAALAVVPAEAQSTPSANLIVGFETRSVNSTLLTALGGLLLGSSQSLGIAAVYAADPTAFATAALLDPSVAWVDDNDAIAAFSAGWDSAGWDSAGWDSAGWDSAGWDSAGWDSAGWDSAGWDSAGWDSAGWDSAGWDSAGWDSAGWDSAGWDSAGWDSAGWDSAGWDSAGWDSAGWDSAGWDSAALTAFGANPPLTAPAGSDRLVKYQWGLAAVNASYEAVRSGSGGTKICVVDSGVDAFHPDLAGRVLSGYDFVNDDPNAQDDAGHGTHVAGIAAGIAGNLIGVAGMSNSMILPVKVLASNGIGEEFDLALGIDFCRAQGAKVISMSLGTPENSKAVHRAVVDAFSAGIVLVASAGNTGTSCNCTQFPAAYPQVISVGAVNPGGKRASFSTVSDGVDFTAPGYAIVSTVPGGYATANGTSQAVPFVAALAALLVDQGATGAEAARAMKETALDLGPEGKDPYTGFGVVNYGRALAYDP